MKIPMNARLLACADLVPQGATVADVGTDHGYLSIYLLQKGIANRVFATDIREKPLEKAKVNASRFGVSGRMQFFCTPGLRGVPREFDTLVCAGMGADTMISILQEAPWLKSAEYRLILQCQSAANDLRRYLWQSGWRITREIPVQDGKFLYTVLEARFGEAVALTPGQEYAPPALLSTGSPLLAPYLTRCIRGLERTVAGIRQSKEPEDQERRRYFERALQELKEMEESL